MKSRAGIAAVWAFAVWALAGFALGVAAVAFGSPSINGVPDPPWTAFLFFPAASAFPIVGALIATRQPRNAVGWILLAFGLMGAVQVPAALYADHHFAHHEGSLPGDEVAAWLSDWLGQTVLFAVVLFLPQLFPTGRPLTRRWRPVLWLSAIVLTGATVGRMLMDAKLGSDPWIVDNPFGVLPIGVYDAFNVSGAFVLPLSFAALVVRFRRSRGDERLQLKWLVCAAAVMAFFFVGALAVGSFSSTLSDVFWATGILGFIALPIVTGIAILRYRLYEIDVIIKRTLLYGALTACVVGAYVVVIALAGALLREQVGIGAAVVATGLVAVMFDPLRNRLQRAVNHLLYGERDDPATAVARLAQRLEVTAAPEAVLPGVVETVAQALRLPYVAIEVEQDGRLERAAAHGQLSGPSVSLPLVYHGASLGQLVLGLRQGEDGFSPEDGRVLADLAGHAGQAVHAVRLTSDLQRARERIVAAREEERRTLRRDLHDGIGPTLAGITLQVDLARTSLGVDDAAALAMVEKLRAETQSAVEDVRRVIEALRPPDRDEIALAGAIRRREIECEASGDFERLPAAVEREPAAARGAGVLRRTALLRRSLVYAAVTALLLGAYVGLLLLIGPLPGTGQGLAVSLVTAIPVALLFGPLRRRLQRAVNRRLYGEDDDPHAAVRELGRTLAASLAPAAALPTVLETVTRTLRVPYAAILIEREGELELAAEQGTAPGERQSVPLAYAGGRVGTLEIGLRPGGELSASDRLLLGGLARQAGVAVHAVRLTSDLQRSRERLVTAREEERRRLRRDLHDGLGPTLAAMLLQLHAAGHLIATDSTAADAALNEVKGAARAAVGDIRRLVYELRPPALDELGLVGALERQAEAFSSLDVRVDAPAPVGGLPAAVEVAAYRIAVEAMTNVARHSQARHCRVCVELNGGLELEVSDDGRGIPARFRANVGLDSMRERAAELGGTCTIERGPSGGTRVRARLPMPEE